jgi:hypothetical protein
MRANRLIEGGEYGVDPDVIEARLTGEGGEASG